MQIASLKDMYLAELQELANAEGQLTDSLLQMAEVAAHPALKAALVHHRAQTEVRKERVVMLLQKHGADPTAHVDQGMQALIHETEKMMSMLKGNELRDAGLIASAQRLKHNEIAAYGTAAALAGQLDLRDDEQVLHRNLEEEKQADAQLTQLATRDINPAAVAA